MIPQPSQSGRRWPYALWVLLIVLLVIAFYFYYPTLAENLQQVDDIVHFWLPRLIIAAIILVFAKVIASAINRTTRGLPAGDRKLTVVKTAGYVIWVVAIVLAIATFIEDVSAFAISAGLIGFGITLALQRPILCFVGWVWITTKNLYRMGDRIKVGDVRGDVMDIGILTTSLWEFGSEWIKADQPSGRMIYIPNSSVLEQPIYNYTRDFPYVWDEVTINVAPESDWKFAVSLLEKIADEIIGDERMSALIERYETELAKTSISQKLSRKPTVHMVSGESWIDLTVRYLVNVRRMRRTKTTFYERILEEFSKHPDKLPPSFRRVQSQQLDETGRPLRRISEYHQGGVSDSAKDLSETE